MKNDFRVRPVSDSGETLIVRTFFGRKVLTDPCRPNTVVLLEVGRVARLVRLPAELQVRHGIQGYALTQYSVLALKDGCRYGFVSNLGGRIHLQDLPEGQMVDVYPRDPDNQVGVRVPAHVPPPVLLGRAVVQVA